MGGTWTDFRARHEAILAAITAIKSQKIFEYPKILGLLADFGDVEVGQLRYYLNETSAGRTRGVERFLHRALAFHMEIAPPSTPLNRDNAVLFSSPKSGTTYSVNFLHHYTDYRLTDIGGNTTNTPDDVDVSALDDALSRGGCVIGSHGVGSTSTVFTLREHNTRPVILVRNIFECIDSYVETTKNTNLMPLRLRQPFGFYVDDPEETRTSAIMYLAEYYVRFFATWLRAHMPMRALILNYSLLQQNKSLFLRALLQATGQPYDPDRFRRAIEAMERREKTDSKALRINRRGSGRGSHNFTEDQKRLVRSLYAMYPNTNFAMIDPEYEIDTATAAATA